MSAHSGPNIVENGLVLSLDAANSKSFRGEPTTNLLSNPKPTSATGYTALGGTGSLTYDSATSSIFWQRSTYEAWGAFLKNDTLFNGSLSISPYTASFEWKESGTISHSSTWFEIVENGDTNPVVKVNMIANSTYLSDGFYRFSYTFTPANTGITAYFRVWNPATTGTTAFYWRNLQLEQKGYRTPFVDGTRGTTVATGGGLADLSGNASNAELVGGPTYNSLKNGSIVLDGVDDYLPTVQVPYTGTSTASVSWEIWVCPLSTSGNIMSMSSVNPQGSWNMPPISAVSQRFTGKMWNNTRLTDTSTYTLGEWYQVVLVWDYQNTTQTLYVNGVTKASQSGISYGASGVNNYLYFGQQNGGADNAGMFQGRYGLINVYGNKALTATEVKNNFNAMRARYGI